jgi:hypothetical protein
MGSDTPSHLTELMTSIRLNYLAKTKDPAHNYLKAYIDVVINTHNAMSPRADYEGGNSEETRNVSH